MAAIAIACFRAAQSRFGLSRNGGALVVCLRSRFASAVTALAAFAGHSDSVAGSGTRGGGGLSSVGVEVPLNSSAEPGSRVTANFGVTHHRALTVEPTLIAFRAAPEPPVTLPPMIVKCELPGQLLDPVPAL